MTSLISGIVSFTDNEHFQSGGHKTSRADIDKMKLYGLMLFHKSPDSVSQLKTAFDLSSFGFIKRRQLRKFICDIGEYLIEQSNIPSRSSLYEQEYFLHCSVRRNGLCAVLASDILYEERTVFRMLEHVSLRIQVMTNND